MPSSNKILGFFGFLSEAPSAFSWCLVQRHFGSSIEARDKHGIQKCSCPEVSKSGCLSPSPKELLKITDSQALEPPERFRLSKPKVGPGNLHFHKDPMEVLIVSIGLIPRSCLYLVPLPENFQKDS